MTEGSANEAYLAARVAQMHFVERRNKVEIAELMGISRFRVARLVDYAIDSGIVQITVSLPAEVDELLGRELRERFGLADALVFPSDETDDPTLIKQGTTLLAAKYLADVVNDGAKLGVSWGTTMDAVAQAVESLPRFPHCDVVQMVGHLPTLEHSLHAADVVRRFTSVARGHAYLLNAPLIVQSKMIADAMREDPSVARTLDAVGKLDVAAVAIGAWSPQASRLREVLPESEVAAIRGFEPFADVCAVIFDKAGRVLGDDYTERVISATADDLRRVPMLVGIAIGAKKAAAVRAVLNADILNVLITDQAAAERILRG